jgi:hypothetical protein
VLSQYGIGKKYFVPKPIPFIFRLRDGIGRKNQDIGGKVLTLHKASSAQIPSSATPTYSAEFPTRNEKSETTAKAI